VWHNRIFDLDNDEMVQSTGPDRLDELDEFTSDHLYMDQTLADEWAKIIRYPLPDPVELTRVAQFNRVISDDMPQAKRSYLRFLKTCLLSAASLDESVTEIVQGLRSQRIEMGFADMVAELDYPRFTEQRPDPMRILAKLRLPIYITTSYYDFLERALRAEGATNVRTRFCLWNMKSENVAPEHQPEPSYVPSRGAPVVYHLHGYEKYPRSLVLSEDDHLDYLMALAQDSNANKPLIPLYIRAALEGSSLLLGDFRILYRGLINARLQTLDRMYGIAIQLDPKFQENITDEGRVRQYLSDYFQHANFQVEWSSIDRFIATLGEEFSQRRG